MTRTEALANLAEQNVTVTARLMNEGVLGDGDLRDAITESIDADLAVAFEAALTAH